MISTMINWELLFKGFCIGFIIATPVGAASILCMRRLLIQGPLAGFFAAIGISTADTFYTLLAMFSLSIVSNIIITYQSLIRICGGMLLVGLGIKFFFKKKPIALKHIQKIRHFRIFSSTFFLTLSNPMVIMFLATFLSSIGLENASESLLGTTTILVGVFCGSFSWWIGMISLSRFFHYHITIDTLNRINKISGALLFFSGLLFFVKSFL